MILVKTEAGQQVLKDRSVRLTPRQRSAFILCDGKRSVPEVIAAGMGIVREDIDELIGLGLLGPLSGGDATSRADVPPMAVDALASATEPVGEPKAFQAPALTENAAPARSEQQRYKDAYPIATRLTGGLGLRGFRLNLSVEGTSTYDDLLALAPKILAAVGPEKFAPLQRALKG